MTTKGKHRGPGEGSYYRRADGKWEVAISVAKPSGGSRRKRKVLPGDTRIAEVKRTLAAMIAERDSGLDIDADKMTVGDWLPLWLEREARPTLKPTTFVTYESIVRLHLVPGLGGLRLQALTPSHLRDFYAVKLREGLSARSVGNFHIVLGRALRIARRDRLVWEIVTQLISPPSPAKFEEDPLTREEVQAALVTAEGSKFGAIYMVLASTGLRLGEALGLTWDAIDLDDGSLRVERSLARVTVTPGQGQFIMQSPKTKQSRRSVALTPRVVEALRKHRTAQREARLLVGPRWEGPWSDAEGRSWDLCFTDHYGRPLNGRSVRYEFDKVLAAAGLRHVRQHALRHGVASALLAAGAPMRVVMDQLGHSQMATTSDLYSHILPEVRRDTAEKLRQYLGG